MSPCYPQRLPSNCHRLPTNHHRLPTNRHRLPTNRHCRAYWTHRVFFFSVTAPPAEWGRWGLRDRGPHDVLCQAMRSLGVDATAAATGTSGRGGGGAKQGPALNAFGGVRATDARWVFAGPVRPLPYYTGGGFVGAQRDDLDKWLPKSQEAVLSLCGTSTTRIWGLGSVVPGAMAKALGSLVECIGNRKFRTDSWPGICGPLRSRTCATVVGVQNRGVGPPPPWAIVGNLHFGKHCDA